MSFFNCKNSGVRFLIPSLFLLVPLFSNAEVKLPGVFSDNMVLQRDIPIQVWGWADKKERITIAFLGDTITVKADKKGNWQAELKSSPAGGPYELLIKGENEIVLSNILVGDVWVCSGQSNMEWPLSVTNTGEEAIAQSTNPLIRLFTVQKNTSTEPLNDCVSEGWLICHPETVSDFSAVGYFFGRKLHEDLDVPIGLLHASWGGTNVETWTSASAIEQVPGFAGISEELASFDEETIRADMRKKVEAITGPLPDEDQGMDGDKPVWANKGTDYSSWNEMEIPGLWEDAGLTGLDGIVWFQKEIVLEARDILNDVEIHLGPIDDSDITYFNGVKIGETTQKYNEARIYPVEKSLLKKGKNSIVVRVEDTGGGGGIYGASDRLFVSLPKKKISLSGAWKYRIGKGDFSFSIGPNSMPSLLYNAMIHPLVPYGIKGAIWYQGESNAGRAYEYRTLFPTMISNWRNTWGQGDFPFLFVQLANYMQPQEKPGESTWAELREAQTMTLALPNTGMATIIDIGEADDIHPRNKSDVGKRLAMSALNVAYGKNVVASGSTYKEMQIDGKKVILSFDNLGSGFYLKDRYGYVKGFALAGEDKVFHWAKAEISGDKIVLSSADVKKPIAVRYAWADNPDDLNLYNLDGLPAVPFRTDDWPGITEGNTYRAGK
jgi:sialate O-acetylesterase